MYKRQRLPLPQDAGDAVLEYMERARPQVVIDRVFPVSYTHLDVYKRQRVNWITDKCHLVLACFQEEPLRGWLWREIERIEAQRAVSAPGV